MKRILPNNTNYSQEKQKYSSVKNTAMFKSQKHIKQKYSKQACNDCLARSIANKVVDVTPYVIPDYIKQLEKEPLEPFCYPDCPSSMQYNIKTGTNILLHGLRYADPLKYLEGIFQAKKILAGKYLDYRFFNQDIDNCNEGEYVSLLESTPNETLEYSAFIKPYICLFVKPLANAYKAHYISESDFRALKEAKIELKNRYSTIHYEYQVKDFISLDDVVAIGLPRIAFIKNGLEYASSVENAIFSLMDKYDVDIPLVDTSYYGFNIPIPNINTDIRRVRKQ